MPSRSASLWKSIGPGILFAGAAVGVSHLVQSTRAGATEGLSLLLVILLANAMKYPAFAAGPWYAAATGTSLLEGYRRQGRFALWLYAGLTLLTMFTVQAAVTIVTAGLFKGLFRLEMDPIDLSIAIMAFCALLLGFGRYVWLDRISRLGVLVLTLSTFGATALALSSIDFAEARFLPSNWNRESLLFLAALIGWMPSAVDISVWHSLWTLAKADTTSHRPSVQEARLDFDIGYAGTAVLAVCFLLLGTAVLYGKAIPLADSPAGFSMQVIGLYTAMLGEWSHWLIGLSALSVMFSTTLTVTDGFPRAIGVLIERLRSEERPDRPRGSLRGQWVATGVLVLGATIVLELWLESLKSFVDIATTLSFLTAPLLAWLNHRALFSLPETDGMRPGKSFRLASVAGIVAMTLFALFYLKLRFL